MLKRIVKNLIPIVIVVGAISFSGALFYLNQDKAGENASENSSLSQEVAQTAIDYINKNMLQEGTTASLISVTEETEFINSILKLEIKNTTLMLLKMENFYLQTE